MRFQYKNVYICEYVWIILRAMFQSENNKKYGFADMLQVNELLLIFV